MDKNSIVGLILIAMVLFGFTYVQRRRYENELAKHPELAQEQTAAQEQQAASQPEAQLGVTSEEAPAAQQATIFKDSLLENAYTSEAVLYTLENDLLSVVFTSKGAQPYSARIKNYTNYDKTDLYLFKDGQNKYEVSVYAGEAIKTSDFVFDLVESSNTRLVFRLPFSGGGYIQQEYELPADSYMMSSKLSFVGMNGVIPQNVANVDIDFATVVPRMEKGFKNESQYSKLDYYFDGEKKPVEMGRGRNSSKRIDSRLSWFAFQQQFFSYIVRAHEGFSLGDLSIDFFSQDDPSRNLMTCKAQMRMELPRQNPGDMAMEFDMYMGPNHYQTLQSYDQKYEKIIPLGGWLVGWFTRFVIIPMFNFFHRFIGSYGLIILLMTLVIKLVVLPFTYKSFASSAKMAALRPFMDKINAKYPKQEDAMKKQQATMDLYKRAGVSPMGGCLPTLLTFPILWAMFRFFPASIELRQQPFLWAKDLSAYDSIIDFGRRIPLLGDHLSLFALLMAVVMWVYSKYTLSSQPNSDDPSAQSMRFMSLWMMPIMMFFICNNLSSALSYYYLLSQLIAMLEIWIIRKFIVKPEAVVEKVKASEGKPVPKSKFQQRLEEAQRMQQQQMRNQQNKKR
ncbi:MAG: membrane protein insertase YidC [Bacteroidales bacterium]|nr:membrane protein insertase YidC [Bacteroidales bacterium]